MPRPLTGSSWERGRRFYASVPEARGSRRRVEASFAAGSERDAWLAAAVAAVDGGCRPPDPASFRNRRADSALLDNSPRPPSVAPTAASAGIGPRPLFEALAYGWLDEYYGQLRNADAERERDVRIMVENYLIPAFAGPVPADAAAARKRLVEFVRRMAREPEWETHAWRESAGDGDRLLTIAEATVACDRSTATIRRALRAGQLPGSRRGPDGRWLIPASVLDAAIRREAPMRTAVSRPYARGILWAHAKILDWGRANGWEIAPFERGVNALAPHDEVARKRPDSGLRRPLTVAELARVASHLHVAHQLVLWLMRVLGLRISEAFGPHVGDVVDLGEMGLIVIQRQGGRAFLTRTRSGVQSKHSKGTLKRAASHRVIAVPGALMAAVRVAVQAFHTDPTTEVVDLEARLVPWIAREGGGQSAFRAALDAGLRREGFDLDTAGFEVVTHDLRKSLATDLAWNPELDELAKRRVMGHKAGDDVFARVYTLDHPTLAPLVKIARTLEADIVGQVPSLPVPTEHRIPWRLGNPLRERMAHIDATLAEAGWQIEPGGDEDPWCDTARVAGELGVAETTARRWMREQVVASTTDTDEFANPRRRSRLADVEAARDRLAGRVVLRDLAAERGVGYYRVWRALRRLDLVEASDDPPPRELVLTSEQAAALRVEFARLAALFDRSMRVSAAATQLGVAFGTAQRFVRRGELVLDPERDAFGAQYVTRASVEALTASRRGGKHAVGADQLVDARTVAQVTGLNQRQLSDLAVRGVLVRRDVGRRFHITAESVERWVARLGSRVPGSAAGGAARGVVDSTDRGTRGTPHTAEGKWVASGCRGGQ
jgi:hypothetical protein